MMGSHTNKGFTIIEVTLFLAITGLLISGVLIGARNNINSQRYRNSVEQFRNTLQGQYERAYSLTNSNANEESGSINPCAVSLVASYKHRGTTNCLYAGRVVEIKSDATTGVSRIKSSPLIARSTVETSKLPSIFDSTDTGTDPIKGYEVFRYDDNSQLVEERALEWDLGVVYAETNNLQSRAIIILRSPIDGNISTYVTNYELTSSQAKNLSSTVRDTATRREAKFCIADLHGDIDPSQRMAVIIREGATGPGSVNSVGDKAGC